MQEVALTPGVSCLKQIAVISRLCSAKLTRRGRKHAKLAYLGNRARAKSDLEIRVSERSVCSHLLDIVTMGLPCFTSFSEVLTSL